MGRLRTRSRLAPNLLLAASLIVAQWGALVHAFEHEAGAPQNQVCKTCVAASQLGAACLDTSLPTERLACYAEPNVDSAAGIKSHHSLVARQRGPPSPL